MKRLLLKIVFSFLVANNISFAQKLVVQESNMGITKEMFSDINIRDAKATIEVWGKIVHESNAKIDDAKTSIFNSVDDLAASINNNEIDVVFLNSIQFLKNENKLNIQPYFGTTTNKKKFFDIYLLSNNSKGNTSFLNLKGKKIIIQAGRYKMINEMWFELLCLENGIKEKENFFKKIEYVESPSKTILAVFFEKADACIATSFSFDVMNELNPQISTKLKVVTKRENLINDLFCLRNNMSEEIRNTITNYGLEIDKKPKTEQVYKIFKIDGSFPFKMEYLHETITLYEDYNKYKSKIK